MVQEMISYASRTGTRRNLEALRGAGWRLLVTPSCVRTEGFRHALDNGAWSSFCQKTAWDDAAFKKALTKVGGSSDFVVVPDIVQGGLASLDLSLKWLPSVLSETRLALIAVQDGMLPSDIEPFLGDNVGIFVGGSTDWKLNSLPGWARLARKHSSYIHVGRVNSAKRISVCLMHSVNSIDGTSASRFSKTIPLLDGALRQRSLFTGHEV
jgi:hypothetical protein